MADFRDILTEQKVIAFIVRKNYKLCDLSSRDMFSINAYKVFFDIVVSNRTTYPKEMLKETASEIIRKSEALNPYILKIYKTKLKDISLKNAKLMIEKLKKLYELRVAAELAEELIENIQSKDSAAVKKTARKIVVIGVSGNDKSNSGEYLGDFEERRNIILARRKKEYVGIPVGIDKFDKVSGGVMNGEVAVMMGESGKGKSIALENFAIFAWMLGYNVVFSSGEMPKHQVQFRADSRIMKMLYSNFRKGTFENEEIIKWEDKIMDLKKSKENFFHVTSYTRGCDMGEVEDDCERVQDLYKKPIDLLIHDYLNITSPKNSQGRRSNKGWESQVEVAWEMKEMATDFCGKGLPIWTGNQVTDDAEGSGELKKSHLKYGRGIVEIVQIIVGLVQSQDDFLENIMRMQCVKVRDLEHIKPIVLRPNFDFMVLNDEKRIYAQHKKTLIKKR